MEVGIPIAESWWGISYKSSTDQGLHITIYASRMQFV